MEYFRSSVREANFHFFSFVNTAQVLQLFTPRASTQTTRSAPAITSMSNVTHGEPPEGLMCLVTMEDITKEDGNYGAFWIINQFSK